MRRFGLLAFLLLVGCAPKMGNSASLITQERIIGVRADPAEAAPGDLVRYASLVASPSGTVDAQDLSWSLCGLRKPVAENTPVSQACLTSDLSQSAQGASASIQTPSSACANFGPFAPPSSTGTLRPSDPDTTGATTSLFDLISAPSRGFFASGSAVAWPALRWRCPRNSAQATPRTRIQPWSHCRLCWATRRLRLIRFRPVNPYAWLPPGRPTRRSPIRFSILRRRRLWIIVRRSRSHGLSPRALSTTP